MSSTDLLLKCQWWAQDTLITPADTRSRENANWGLAFHEVMAWLLRSRKGDDVTLKTATTTIAAKFSIEDVNAFHQVIIHGFKVLETWLSGDNEFGYKFLAKSAKRYVEQSFAWHVASRRARFCAPPDEVNHVYPDRKPDEFCGTANLVVLLRGKKQLLVLDYKTGVWGALHRPDKLKQLWSLARAAALAHGAVHLEEAILATLHVPRDGAGAATVYAHSVKVGLRHGVDGRLSDPDEWNSAVNDIEAAFTQRNAGYLRPGAHCLDDYCPAFAVCPSNRNALVELRRKSGPLLTAEDVGAAHQQLQLFRATFKRLDDAADAELRAEIERRGPCPRPDGKEVLLQPGSPRKNLSLASIERRLAETSDPVARDQILKLRKKLEELGCVEETTPKPSLVAR